MKKTLLLSAVLALALLASAPSAQAQVLTTGQTLGKGNQLAMVSESRLAVDSVTLNIPYVMYARGLSKEFDLYILLGDTSIFGENQVFAGVGGNLHLFKVGKLDISTLNVVSAGLHRRHESSSVLLNDALIASYAFNARFSLYSGVNALVPVGARERGLFTPPTYKVNVPIGAAFTFKQGKWSLFVEQDIGRLKATGIGVSRSF